MSWLFAGPWNGTADESQRLTVALEPIGDCDGVCWSDCATSLLYGDRLCLQGHCAVDSHHTTSLLAKCVTHVITGLLPARFLIRSSHVSNLYWMLCSAHSGMLLCKWLIVYVCMFHLLTSETSRNGHFQVYCCRHMATKVHGVYCLSPIPEMVSLQAYVGEGLC